MSLNRKTPNLYNLIVRVACCVKGYLVTTTATTDDKIEIDNNQYFESTHGHVREIQIVRNNRVLVRIDVYAGRHNRERAKYEISIFAQPDDKRQFEIDADQPIDTFSDTDKDNFVAKYTEKIISHITGDTVVKRDVIESEVIKTHGLQKEKEMSETRNKYDERRTNLRQAIIESDDNPARIAKAIEISKQIARELDIEQGKELEASWCDFLETDIAPGGAIVTKLNKLFFGFHDVERDKVCNLAYGRILQHIVRVQFSMDKLKLAALDYIFKEYGFDAVGRFRHEISIKSQTHDKTKLMRTELFPYMMLNIKKMYEEFGKKNPFDVDKRGLFLAESEHIMNLGWEHHKLVNPHHPEYWIEYEGLDQMPDDAIYEMVCDWASFNVDDPHNLRPWVEDNPFKKYQFSDSQLQFINYLVDQWEGGQDES